MRPRALAAWGLTPVYGLYPTNHMRGKAVRLTDRVEQTVIQTLAEQLGEDYDHEVFLTMQPSPRGPVPCIVILVVGRGVALDEVITASPIVIPTPRPDAALVANQVQQAVFAIQAERARQSQTVPLLGVPR